MTRIVLVAPAGQVLAPERIEQAVRLFRSWDWDVVADAAVFAVHQRFGGTDAMRLAALHRAIADPANDLVLAVRGGYGCSRLLDRVDYATWAAAPALLCGHSDLTALSFALQAQTGRVSLSGPMASFDFGEADPDGFMLEQFRAAVAGEPYGFEVSGGTPPNAPARLAGTLWGGNLTMVCHLIGTPYWPRIDGGLLFLEDVAEHPYRVERLLYQLFHAGVLQRQQAILLGDFSDWRPVPNDNGYDLASVVEHFRERLSVPIFTGLPFGHVRRKTTLPVGGAGELLADGRGWALRVAPIPKPSRQRSNEH